MSLNPTTAANDLLSRSRAAGYEPAALDATILVVGMGALGQNVALNLALSGVRELRLVDADRFEAHNRTRSPLYACGDNVAGVGAPKARSTAANLRPHATHPSAVIRWADAWIEDLGAGAFDDVDVVACCVDVLPGRAYLADQCRLRGIAMVEAGFGGPDVTVATFPAATEPDAAQRAACWRCGKVINDDTVSCRLRATYAEVAGMVPAIQTAAATLGGIQAEALIEVLHGHVHEPRRTWLNIRTGESASARLTADPCCTGVHRLAPTPIAVDLGPQAPIEALLKWAAARLGGPPVLELPVPFVDAAVCPGCDRAIDIRSPGHRYRRDPSCVACKGPWPPAPDDAGQLNPVSRVRPGDPLAGLQGQAVGLAAGDRVVVADTERELVLRLAGTVDDLFEATR